MNRGMVSTIFLSIVLLWWIWYPLDVHAEIASDNAFEGVTWEMIIEDDREAGVVQSICATEDYIITLENYADGSDEPDIVKAYYRNDTDADGNPVEKYSLAKRVAVTNYEHANGMAYNPNTKEIAVALYTHMYPENRGCIYIMDADTLEYKSTIKISDDYNILGIDYDEENDRYVIQTNADGGYSFKILDHQFQVTEDLGEYAGTAKGDNFQDLCVSGDYIINFPLTYGMGIGDYVNMYSISRRTLVSESLLNFNFENVTVDEPESICELEPGVFAAVVNVSYTDGSSASCIYKTMVPYNFTAADLEKQKEIEAKADSGTAEKERAETEKNAAAQAEQSAKSGQTSTGKLILKTLVKVVVIFVILAGALFVLYLRILIVRRERKRKLERTRRARARIQSMYED